MYTWDIARAVAVHYERAAQERDAERRAERDRLVRALEEPALPAKAREALAVRVARRMLVRARLSRDDARIQAVSTIVSAIEAGRSPGDVIERVTEHLAVAQRTVETWSKWGEGCELEGAQLERELLVAGVAVSRGADGCTAVVTAALEHAALHEALELYGRAMREAPMALAYHLGYLREAATIIIDLFGVIADG